MASPQPDKFTKIANELLEVFVCAKFTEYERCILLTLIRKTYGWGKKMDWISHGQFSDATGIPRSRVCNTIKSLEERKIIKREGRKIGLQKDWELWEVEWRVLPHQVTGVTSPGNRGVTCTGTHKRKKETIQKKLGETSSPDNKKDMNWKKQSDDFEEGVVDLDGDGSLTEEKKPQTKKYPNAPAVRKVFQEVLGKNPANWKINKTQLQACENLYTERGLSKIKNALEFYIEHKGEEFCPVVDSPYDLDTKYTNLSRYKKFIMNLEDLIKKIETDSKKTSKSRLFLTRVWNA